MRRVALGALLSHWKRRPVQLAMLVLGLSLATALWSGVQAINAEARAAYAEAAATLGQDRLARLVPADAAHVDEADFVALRRAGWLVAPVLEGRMRLGGERVTVMGVDPLTAPPQEGLAALDEDDGLAGFTAPPGRGLAAPETAAELADAPLPVEPARGIAPGIVIVDIGIAQRLLDAPGRLSYLQLHPDQPPDRPALSTIAPQLEERPHDDAGELARLTDSFHLNLTAFGFLSFAVGLFIVHSAVGLAFEQRRPVFRTLRALGLPASSLMALLVAELAALALIAGALGVALGYLVAAVLMPGVAATLGGLYGAEIPGSVALRPQWWLSGLAIALAGTLVAAARDLWRTARLPVLAAARPRAWALISERALAAQLGAAAVLALVAVALAQIGGGLVGGFTMLAALLLSAALALPVILYAVLRGAQALARGPVAQWFWADTRQQLPGLSLALMALLLALAANIGVGTMVSSFRLTFTGWLDQRLAAELYVTARSDAEAEAIRDWLAPRADAILPIWYVEGDLAGRPGRVYSVADHATYRDHWPLIDAGARPWERVAAGEGVLVNEQLARAEGLWAGDGTLDLPGGPELPVVGVYSDYGNPQPQVMLGLDAFTRHYPDAPQRQHGVRAPPEAVHDLAAELRTEFDLPDANVTDQAEAKRFSLQIFERTFTVTRALNVLTLGVAGVALLASLVTLSGMRLAQLAPVWAMGLGRARLARLELWRALALAGFTALAALPVGLLLAWVLLAVINVEAFGWRLPLHVFPADWARLGAVALVTGALAAALPALRLARIAPAQLVKVFAHER